MIQSILYRAGREGSFPDSFKKAKTVLIPKGTPGTKPQDYRPIALLNTMYKVLDMVVTEEVTKVVNPQLLR